MDFTHLDDQGRVRMVDVSQKRATLRMARTQGEIRMQRETLDRLLSQQVKKGNVLETARIAGVMGAKRTAELIPMCHPLNLTHVSVDFEPDLTTATIRVEAKVKCFASTGVEMEALTAVSTACLTIYDMCKSYDRGMQIGQIQLLEKSGGKSGHYLHAP